MGEAVQRDLAAHVFTVERGSGLVGHDEPGSQSDPRQDLNRLEDREGHDRHDQETDDPCQELEASPFLERLPEPPDWVGTLAAVRSVIGWGLALLLLVFLAGFFFFPDDVVSDNPGLSGDYIINGVDPQGDEYAGVLSISQRADGDYDFSWIVTSALIEGIGRIDGDVVEVTWTVVDSQAGQLGGGFTRFEIGGDGVLRGVRTVDGVAGEGTEDAFPND